MQLICCILNRGRQESSFDRSRPRIGIQFVLENWAYVSELIRWAAKVRWIAKAAAEFSGKMPVRVQGVEGAAEKLNWWRGLTWLTLFSCRSNVNHCVDLELLVKLLFPSLAALL